MGSSRARRRLMGEINVVPYIDVMLVLLVIFMVTTPLLTQGVKVEMPKAAAKPLDIKDTKNTEPVVLTVDQAGQYYLNVGEDQSKPLEPKIVVARVAAVLKYKPGTPVLIKGDGRVPYAQVVRGMVLLQAAGAPSVGLMTEPPDKPLVERRP